MSHSQKLPPIQRVYAGKVYPHQLVEAFAHIEHYFPTRTVNAGNLTSLLQESFEPLEQMSFQSKGMKVDLYDYVSRNRVVGLLVTKNQKVVYEHYEQGLNQQSRWMSMSMAKSISTTLIGAALQDGLIKDLQTPLQYYLPKLANSSYANVTVRQLLLMSSGVKWREEPEHECSERRAVLELQVQQKPGAILEYMSALQHDAPPGDRWNYSTGETHLVGELLKQVSGDWLSTYLSKKIWQPCGMQQDAEWWLEAPSGLEVAGSGICASLRDFARFALLVENDGVIDGQQLVPTGWFDQASGPSQIGSQQVPYGFMWWSVPNDQNQFHERAFAAKGLFGQRMYINRKRRITATVLSARSKPMNDEPISDFDFFNALCAHI